MPSLPKFPLSRGIACLLIACGATPGWGQTAVTNWTLQATDTTNSTPYGSSSLRFQNTTHAVTGFTTGSTNYWLATTANAAYIRRNTDSSGNGTPNQANWDNNNYSSTWVADNGAGRALGTYQSSLSNLLLNNNVIQGSDNLFVNSNDSATVNAGNIERVDFAFTSGTTARSTDGITIFDRGVAGAHDSVKIAVFTGWDSTTNRPTAYGGNIVTLTSGNYGSNLDYNPSVAGVQDPIADYYIMRFNNGDNLTSLSEYENATNQGIAGAFISFANLGIAAGTTIYGYSVFSADVTNTVANLVDWTNTTYYPTNTADGSGGIDLVGFNGRIARPVPEPATYGMLLMGATLVAFVGFRLKQAKTA